MDETYLKEVEKALLLIAGNPENWYDLYYMTGMNKKQSMKVLETIKKVKKKNHAKINPPLFGKITAIEQKYKTLQEQVVWAVAHFGVVKTEGIFEHLKNTLEQLERRNYGKGNSN